MSSCVRPAWDRRAPHLLKSKINRQDAKDAKVRRDDCHVVCSLSRRSLGVGGCCWHGFGLGAPSAGSGQGLVLAWVSWCCSSGDGGAGAAPPSREATPGRGLKA